MLTVIVRRIVGIASLFTHWRIRVIRVERVIGHLDHPQDKQSWIQEDASQNREYQMGHLTGTILKEYVKKILNMEHD